MSSSKCFYVGTIPEKNYSWEELYRRTFSRGTIGRGIVQIRSIQNGINQERIFLEKNSLFVWTRQSKSNQTLLDLSILRKELSPNQAFLKGTFTFYSLCATAVKEAGSKVESKPYEARSALVATVPG